jgi:pyruvate dehydrogenase E2 component (dihydrolipoamide acetyltransferase)
VLANTVLEEQPVEVPSEPGPEAPPAEPVTVPAPEVPLEPEAEPEGAAQEVAIEPAGEASDAGYAPAEPVATDAARALAEEKGIDLATVQGTGAEGRITKDDVAAVLGADESTASE